MVPPSRSAAAARRRGMPCLELCRVGASPDGSGWMLHVRACRQAGGAELRHVAVGRFRRAPIARGRQQLGDGGSSGVVSPRIAQARRRGRQGARARAARGRGTIEKIGASLPTCARRGRVGRFGFFSIPEIQVKIMLELIFSPWVSAFFKNRNDSVGVVLTDFLHLALGLTALFFYYLI